MRPLSGTTIPATARSSVVLPEPDGPKRIVTPSGASKSTSSTNERSAARSLFPFRVCDSFPTCFLIETCSMPLHSLRPAARQFVREINSGDRHRRQNQGQELRLPVCACEDRFINRERHGLRFAREVAGEHQGRAELAERARKTQDNAGQNASAGERQRDTKKGLEFAFPEAVGGDLVS